MDIIHEPLIKKRNITLKFPELLEVLDLALQYPAKASQYVKDFESKTFEVYLYAEQSIEWMEKQEFLGFITESSLSSFRLSSVMILDRYTELNRHMLKGLAQLFVVGGQLGKCAMSLVSETSQISNQSETCEIILEVISPLMELFEDFTIDLKKNILSSLTKLPTLKRLSNCLQPTIQYVISDIVKEPWKTEMCDLFVLLTLDEDNASDINHYPVSKFLIRELEQHEIKNGMISSNMDKRQNIIKFLKVISASVKSCDVELVSEFCSSVLIPNIKNLIRERVPTKNLSEEEAELGYHLIKLSTNVCQYSKDLLDELCNGFHLFDLLLVPVKENIANLQILSSSLEGICYILLHEHTTSKYSMLFIEEFDPILMIGYLEDKNRERLVKENKSGVINELYLWYYRFIATLLYLSKTNYNMTGFVEKMVNKGINFQIINNFGFAGSDLNIRCELMNIISLFPDDWIDSSIVNKLLNLLSNIDITNYHEKELESIVIILNKRLELSPMDSLINYVVNLLVATLSIPNTRKYESLQVKIVKLLLEASQHETGRIHLRTENIMGLLLKGLKYEQDYSNMECQDINVELCWTGNNCRFLDMCMYNTYHLKYDKKQFYRVLRSLERCLNGFDVFNNEKMLTFENLCMKETEDFFDEASGVYEVNFLSNSDMNLKKELQSQNFRQINQHQQTSLFLNFDLSEKILGFLSPLYSLHFIKYYQYEKLNNTHSEYWAGILKGNKLDYEKTNIIPKIDEYSELYNNLYEQNIGSDDDNRENTKINKTTTQLLTHIISNNLNKSSYQFTECDYFKILPNQLLNKVYLNEYTRQINPAFLISSYMRILHGLLDCGDGEIIKNKFKNPDFVRNLIKLATSCNVLDCNVTSKLFKLFTKSLTYNISLKAESMDMIIIYDIISKLMELVMKYVVSECILNVNHNWIDDKNKHIQYLILQLVKFVNMMSRQVPLIKFSNVLEIQEYFVEKCLNRFISELTIRIVMKIFIQIITFQNMTSTGTYTAHMFDTNVLESIVDNILLIIIQLVSHCTNTNSYYIMNIIAQFRRYDTISLKSSLLNSLLKQIYLHRIKSKFQLEISKTSLERIIIFDQSYILTNCFDNKSKNYVLNEDNMYLICISNKNLYLLNYLKDKDEFEILRSFNLKKILIYSINQGIIYLLHKDPIWVIFSLSYVNYDLMKYLCFENINSLSQQLSHQLSEKLADKHKDHHKHKEFERDDLDHELTDVLITVAKYEDRYSLAVITPDNILVYEILPESLLDSLVPKSEKYNKVVLKTFIIPEAPDKMTRESTHVKFIKLVHSVKINEIVKVKFDHHFGVLLYHVDPDDEDPKKQEETTELDFINYKSRERFKKFLAKNISDSSWKRSWLRHSPD